MSEKAVSNVKYTKEEQEWLLYHDIKRKLREKMITVNLLDDAVIDFLNEYQQKEANGILSKLKSINKMD